MREQTIGTIGTMFYYEHIIFFLMFVCLKIYFFTYIK